MSGAGDTAAMEEYLAPENSSERMIQILMRRSRNYLHWLDNETAYFWAEKAVALAIENYNTSENISPIRPFTKGSQLIKLAEVDNILWIRLMVWPMR